MKKFLLLTILLTVVLKAQTEEREVELPDFVIIGRQRIEVQPAVKDKPDFMKIISEDFLLPKYPPEELPLLLTSEIKSTTPNLDDLNNAFFGSLYVGLGKHTYPVGELNLNKSIDYYLLHAKIFGSNIKEYVPYAGYNVSGVSIDNTLFVSTKSNFLEGSEIKLNGNYIRDSYRFFGSIKSDSLRETNRFYGNFSISNNYNQWFNFGINFQPKFLSISDINLKEKLIEGTGFSEIKFSKIAFGGNLLYKKQYLQNNISGVDNYDYYLFNGYLKIFSIKNILLNTGVVISKNKSNDFLRPFGSIEMKLSEGLIFSSEFKPYTNFSTVLDFIDNNLYVINTAKDNVYDEIPINLSALIKYENKEGLSLKLSGTYKKHKNFLYFEDEFNEGFFHVNSAEAKEFLLNFGILYNTFNYGKFDMTFKYHSVKDINNHIIPFNPLYNLIINYYYNFSFGLSLQTSYQFFKESYADLLNKSLIEDYHNLSLSMIYNFFNNLSIKVDFQNILNRSNFVLKGYRGKSFDVILGIEYRWQ
ncbi:MAG: hypothetical protein N2249_01770 [Melioribacter sp.]|nr:hypothetical protein [Melioribacter sp.]